MVEAEKLTCTGLKTLFRKSSLIVFETSNKHLTETFSRFKLYGLNNYYRPYTLPFT